MSKQTLLKPITQRILVALFTFVVGLAAFSSKSVLFGPAQKRNKAQPVFIIPSPPIAVYPAQPKAEDVPQSIKDLEITPVHIKAENTRLLFKMAMEYPQIRDPKTSQQRRFNRYVRKIFSREIRSFKAFCSKHRKYPNGELRGMEYFLGGHYEVLYGDKNLVSIKITFESFTGYVNSDWYIVSINYDLRKGRLLKLPDLFIPESNYLKVLSELCIRELEKQDLSCSGNTGSVENSEGTLAEMRKGAEPKEANYQHWNITRNGIKVTFGEYQIGPGCLGLIDVDVPYSLLRERHALPARSGILSSILSPHQ